MVFVRKKVKNGKAYYELVKSKRIGQRVIQTVVKYLGSEEAAVAYCKAHGISPPKISASLESRLALKTVYYQAGNLFPLASFPWMVAMGEPTREVFGRDFTPMVAFFRKGSCKVLYDKEHLDALARNALEKFSEKSSFSKFYAKWLQAALRLEKIALQALKESGSSLGTEGARRGVERAWNAFVDFWKYSVFIDSFDAGTDFREIERIAKANGLPREEIQILTTPSSPSYLQEFEKAVFEAIARPIEAEAARKLSEKFFWINTDYTHFDAFGQVEALKEMRRKKKEASRSDLVRLRDADKRLVVEQNEIIRRKRLGINPLWLYNELVAWRDARKKYNFIGLYGLLFYAFKYLKAKGVPMESAWFVSPLEIIREVIPSAEELKRRANGGLLAIGLAEGLETKSGVDAVRDFERLEKKKTASTFEVRGQPACLGRVIGKVRVVHGPSEFGKFKKGEVLVTVMTRPEFVPLMSECSGIITDEGGVTCHAAIVSRELNKPCIIGTQNATKLLKDGDEVELDANHGIVKKR